MTRLSLSISTAVLVALTGCATTPTSTAPAPVEVHTFTSGEAGFHTNSAWIDTGSEVVVFDTQFTPALAEELRAEIARQTTSPIRWAVVTHPNPDKFNGASVFEAAGATVVASESTLAAMPAVHDYKKSYFTSVGMFTEASYPALPTIGLAFEGAMDLPVDGASVRLEELAHPGVTTTQTIARVGDAVIVGDLVASETHAWLEGGIVDGAAVPDLAGWRAALAELLELVGPDAVVVPGRGRAARAGDVLPAQIAYLEDAERVTREYLAALDDPAAALSDDGATHYAALTEQLASLHPEYAHPYLVQYGIYGLAWHLVGELGAQ